MRGPGRLASPRAAALRLRWGVLIGPLQLILPVGYLLPQSPDHELAPAQIPHLHAAEWSNIIHTEAPEDLRLSAIHTRGLA